MRPKVCKWFFGCFSSCFLCLYWLEIGFYSLHGSTKKIQSYFVYLSWMEDCHLTESIRILLIASRSMLNIYNMLNQRFNLSIEHMLLCNVYRFLYKENQTFNIVSHCMSITPAPDSSRATLLRLMLNQGRWFKTLCSILCLYLESSPKINKIFMLKWNHKKDL